MESIWLTVCVCVYVDVVHHFLWRWWMRVLRCGSSKKRGGVRTWKLEEKGKVNKISFYFYICVWQAVAGQRRINHRRPAGERFVWAWKRKVYGYTQKNWGTHSTTTSSKVLLVLPHTHETAGYSSFFGFFFGFFIMRVNEEPIVYFNLKKIKRSYL